MAKIVSPRFAHMDQVMDQVKVCHNPHRANSHGKAGFRVSDVSGCLPRLRNLELPWSESRE